MTDMSHTVLETVQLFAESMDIEAIPANDGSFTFLFERSGALTLTNSLEGDRIHVSLMRQPFRSDTSAEHRLLDQAGFDHLTNTFLHVGLTSDGSFVCATDIEVHQFDLPLLDQAFRRLTEALDNAAS